MHKQNNSNFVWKFNVVDFENKISTVCNGIGSFIVLVNNLQGDD